MCLQEKPTVYIISTVGWSIFYVLFISVSKIFPFALSVSFNNILGYGFSARLLVIASLEA